MPFSLRLRRTAEARWAAAGRHLQRFALSTREMVAIAAGIIVLGVSVVALAGVSEDVIRHDGLTRGDASHLHFFLQHRSVQLVQDARWMTDLGGIGLLVVLAVLVAGVLWLRGARLVMAFAPGLALGAAGACAAIGKQLVGRARPPVALRLVNETETSFPSGHATDSTAFYVTLALIVAVVVLRRPLARVATIAAAALLSTAIGASRLILGVHWPTDVLAGWALGSTVALTVSFAAVALDRFVDLDVPPPQRRAGRLLHRLGQLLLVARPVTTTHASPLRTFTPSENAERSMAEAELAAS